MVDKIRKALLERKKRNLVRRLELKDETNPVWDIINDETFKNSVGVVGSRYNLLKTRNGINSYTIPLRLKLAMATINDIREMYRTDYQLDVLETKKRVEYQTDLLQNSKEEIDR